MTIPLYTQTISVAGQPLIKGNATLLAGSNVTLTQTGKQITIATTGGGAGAVDSVNGQTGVVVLAKSDIGLGNVDNTSDANKPVSTAQALADTAVEDYSIQRSHHTGTQLAATISDLGAAIAAASNVFVVAAPPTVKGFPNLQIDTSGGNLSFWVET